MKTLKLIGLLLSIFLTACVATVVAGTAAGAIVYDGRGIVMLERDTRIFHRIHTAIASNPAFRGSNVSVTSFNQVVLLVGQVSDVALKQQAEKIAKTTPHVVRVYNEITIGEPMLLSERAKDTWITGQVRSKMLLRKGLESGSIRVVTDDAVVYLMGRVTREQSELAVDVARHIQGVKRVVKVFRYVN